MSLDILKGFAVKNNFTAAAKPKATPIYELSIEEARKRVVVRDGNKTPKADGSQALVLGFGRVTLPLDAINKGATRVNATKEQVPEFTKILVDAVASGAFDEAITQAQLKLLASKESAASGEQSEGEAPEVEAPVANPAASVAGLDLDAIA